MALDIDLKSDANFEIEYVLKSQLFAFGFPSLLIHWPLVSKYIHLQ